MRLDTRLKRIEQCTGTRDNNPPVYVVRISEKLSFEEWTRKAREQAQGLPVHFPTREIKYAGGVMTGLD